MQVRPLKTRLFKESEDLIAFIRAHVKRLKNGSVLVISSKIVSLSEGRTANPKDREHLIKKESAHAIKTPKVWLTEKDGVLMANAGIDESNANGKIVLLPKDSYKTAGQVRAALMSAYKVKNLGVIICDSVVMPLRRGVIGLALGYAGFEGVKDYRGKKDLFGRAFTFASANIADGLAATAMLTMGEGKERQPLALIEDAPISFTARSSRGEMRVGKDDMFQPLLKAFGGGNR